MPIDFQQARFAMVEQQVRPWDVLDPRVLEVLMTVQREDFVPPAHRKLAFADLALPLGHDDQTNLPVGVMFTGPVGGERLLLQLALDLEAASPFRSLA